MNTIYNLLRNQQEGGKTFRVVLTVLNVLPAIRFILNKLADI